MFLSYASQDQAAAQRIGEALHAAGVEVWFDRTELRGGDAWDQMIRHQIKECALFVPLISAHAQVRGEGYFRLEWKLAADRSHLMARDQAFLLPVVIDATLPAAARVPEEFHAVQWMHLPDGAATADFSARVKTLLAGGAPALAPTVVPAAAPAPLSPRRRSPAVWLVPLAFAAVVVVALQPWRKVAPSDAAPPPATANAAALVATAPSAIDARSIAVLPFENLSTEPDAAYFAAGIHEEVLTAVAKISALKVIARTSVLRFAEAKTRDLRRIGAELGVANLLEGSVRRAGNRVRITVQLVEAQTSRQLWGNTYERELTDTFAIQASIAQEITATLQAALTPAERTRLEQQPTRNAEAYQLYLRAMVLYHELGTPSLAPREKIETVISLFERAAALDPEFALPLVQLAQLHGYLYWFGTFDPTPARAQRAIATAEALRRIAPDAPETHQTMGAVLYQCRNDWEAALKEFRLARPGLPNDSKVFQWEGFALRRLGRWAEAKASFENSLMVEPQNAFAAESLVETVRFMRRYAAAVQVGADSMRRLKPSASLIFDSAAAQLALDGDTAAYLRTLQSHPSEAGYSRRHVWDALLMVRDYPAARDFLRAGGRTQLSSLGAIVNDPIQLYLAQLAFLRDQPAEARTLAREALAYYANREWSARQRPFVAAGRAMAAALAGDAAQSRAFAAESAQLLQASPDAFNASFLPAILGPAFVVLGDTDAALAELRRMVGTASDASPASVRADPFWSRLASDPRFEAILADAKSL